MYENIRNVMLTFIITLLLPINMHAGLFDYCKKLWQGSPVTIEGLPAGAQPLKDTNNSLLGYIIEQKKANKTKLTLYNLHKYELAGLTIISSESEKSKSYYIKPRLDEQDAVLASCWLEQTAKNFGYDLAQENKEFYERANAFFQDANKFFDKGQQTFDTLLPSLDFDMFGSKRIEAAEVEKKLLAIKDMNGTAIAYYSITQDSKNPLLVTYHLYRISEQAIMPQDIKDAQIAEITVEFPKNYTGQLEKIDVKKTILASEDMLFYSALLSLNELLQKMYPKLDLQNSIDFLIKKLGANRIYLQFATESGNLEQSTKNLHNDLMILGNAI